MQAAETVEQIFGSEENARNTAGLVQRFVASYETHKTKTPLDVWLADEFRQFPALWSGEEEIVSTAREVISSVEQANADRQSLQAHMDKGKSKESWLAKKIETSAAAAGASNVGTYAAGIDTALSNANEQMLKAVTRRTNSAINMGPNLDGFIAEQHHVNTFNLDAAAKGSPLRAKVMTPELGEAFGKNSMDIGIYDGNGKLVGRYQAKYGQDADTTVTLFKRGDYRGQQKLVPADQVEGVSKQTKATDILENGGVKSKPMTKAEAKAEQERVQQEQEIRQYDWNDTNRIEIARKIGKQALVGAALTCAFQGGRILARRAWNFLCDKENPAPSEDLKEFFENSVKGAAHVGVQVAVSGAVVVAAKNGWIKVLRNTPAGKIASIVYVGLENAKVLYQFATGKLSAGEAVDAMGGTTCSAVGGLAGAAKGAALGAVLGGPLGAFIGGVAGGMAGSTIGEALYEGGKKIAKAAVSVVKCVCEGIKSSASSFVSTMSSFFSVSNLFS